MNNGRRHSHSFVFRIWQEGDDAPWRGWIQHVASGDSCYFDNLAQLLSFAEAHAGNLGEFISSPWGDMVIGGMRDG